MGGGRSKRLTLPKICHTYPAMMKLGTVVPYLKKVPKNMNRVTHPLSSADKSANFAISRNTDMKWVFTHNFSFF